MSMSKKMFALIMMITLIIISAACTGDSTESEPNENQSSSDSEQGTGEINRDELYTIKVLVRPTNANANITMASETPIFEVIKEKFNIDFEIIPFSGDYRNRLNTMLAAGDYPELLRIERNDIVQRYINAGAAIALDDYLDNMPNFTERFQDNIPYWRIVAEDGKLYKWEYSIPQDKFNVCECNDMAVRTDVLEQQGWPNLVSEDDYIQFLKKGLEDNPETNGRRTLGMVVPFAEAWGIAGVAPIMYEKGGDIVALGNEGVLWNQVTGEFEHMLTHEYTKESFQWFNRLYREGILDRESFTDTSEQVREKLQNGQALSIWYAQWEATGVNRRLEAAGSPELQYISTPIQSNTQVERGEKRPLRIDTTRPFDSVIITKNAEHPERIIELIDWIASEEGQILLQSGIEGRHYEIVDGKRVPTEEHKNNILNDPDYLGREGFGLLNLLGFANTVSPVDGQYYTLTNEPSLRDELALTERQKEAYQNIGWEHSRSWWEENGEEAPTGVAAAIMIDPSTELGMVHQQMTELRVRSTAQLIQAESDEEFENVWERVLEDYSRLDAQRVVDEFNRLYQEEMANFEG